MSTENPDNGIHWRLTTWDGARREALRRWAELPLERMVAALEEMQELNTALGSPTATEHNMHAQPSATSDTVHEPHPEYRTTHELDAPPELPHFTDTQLAAFDIPTLIALLKAHEDRVPRNLIDVCASRGDGMTQALETLFDSLEFWNSEVEPGTWWLRLHIAMILGLIPTECAGLQLVDLMRRLDAIDDLDMQDWLAGNWPALFANKPTTVANALRTLAEDRACDLYMRANAAETVVRLAYQTSTAALEAALDWLVRMVDDEQEDWDTRLIFCHTLLDFPRDRYRPLLERLAAQQTGLGKAFDAENIESAHAAGHDQPGWEHFNDPWKFYAPDAIAARQRRWAEEDRQEIERSQYTDEDFIWHEPYVRLEPKIGRNDPCPCGSGKKYKKCCLDKAR